MYAQVITFNLRGMTEEEWREAARRNSSKYAEFPGLLAKLWMTNRQTNAYGAVYIWRDRESLEAYKQSPLTERIRNHPNYENVSFSEYELFEDLIKLTQPGLQLV